MLLAFSAKPEELDILMLSLTFGNVDVQRCACILVSGFELSSADEATSGLDTEMLRWHDENVLTARQLFKERCHAVPLHRERKSMEGEPGQTEGLRDSGCAEADRSRGCYRAIGRAHDGCGFLPRY